MKTDWPWYDEAGTIDWEKLPPIDLKAGGVNWWYPQEEKQVKQIDFSKPVVMSGGRKGDITVMEEGLTLIKIDEPGHAGPRYAVIDEKGKSHLCTDANHDFNRGSAVKFENKPEEPKDHLCLYKYRGNDWAIVYTTTKADAEDWHRRNKPYFENSMIVKVPV